jgi:cytoskeletal protein RodZ
MNCQTCGAPLPPGAQVCPNCGAATPYNPGYGGGPSQVDPTVLAGPSNPSSPYGGTPPTAYGSSPNNYGVPPSPQNPYEAPPPPPNQYGEQYGTPQQNAYGTPAAPQQYPYNAQQQPGGYGVPPQAPKRRSKIGLIIGVVVLVVLVLCIGISVAVYEIGKNTSTTTGTPTATAKSTATTSSGTTPTTSTSTGQAPSGNAIDSTAAGIVSHLQTASAIDSNYNATSLSSTFKVNQPVYVTYQLNMGGQTGYVEVKWYVAGQFGKSKIFNANDPSYTHGYFSETYTVPTKGEAELYWCTQADCSDEALAGFVNFTISSSSLHTGGQPSMAFSMAMNRRDE